MAVLLERPVKHRSNGKYPWHEWLDGKPRRLKRSVDFAAARLSMKSAIHFAAKWRSLDVITSMHGDDEIDLQVLGSY